MNAVRTAVTRDLNFTHFTSFRSILLGAGLCYAISEGKYHHTPLAFFVPSAYTGYQLYKNRENAAGWVREKFLA